MNKLLLIGTFILSSFISICQTTITNTSKIGYSTPLIVASSATAALIPYGFLGANVTWNCSGLQQETGTPIINYTVSSPAGTIYASDYPKANWYFTDPNLTALIGHNYYTISSDTLVKWGEHTPGKSYTIYDNPELDLKFPFSYTNTFSKTYSKTNYNANGSISSYQTGNVILTYEGYGTLILPNGTFGNVAKIKRERTNSLGSTTISYVWLLISTGERLMSVETNGGLRATYNNKIPSSAFEIVSNKDISIYPNPSKSISNLSLNVFNTNDNFEYEIYDLAGKIMIKEKITNSIIQINSSFINSGIYLVKILKNNTMIYSQKYIVE